MAITQGIIDNYLNASSGTKQAASTSISNIVTSLSQDDCLAYFNTKDKMYYFVKVVTKTGTNQDAILTVKGVRFKFATGTTVSINSLLTNVCINGKDSIMQNQNLHDKIAFVEFFGRQTLSISSLLHNETMDFSDDITEVTVLPITSPVVLSGTDFIVNVIDDPPATFLMHGMARQLAYNFINSI